MTARLLPRGLRGRLLAAFVLTSAVTLAVAAAVMLSPLRDRLRSQSVEALRAGVTDLRPQFDVAIGKPLADRFSAVVDAGNALQDRANARVLVDALDDDQYFPDFYYDSEFSSSTADATEIALRSLREGTDQMSIEGDTVIIADVLRVHGDVRGVLVAQRRLTEVTTAVDQVRNALLAAAGVGLLVAILLGVTLSNTLLRRLARLRAVALRISAEGPDAPSPRDTGRDEVGDLARALARMQEDLRRQEAARRSFVSTASHELRTPLTMLQGTMELLEEDLRDGADLADAQEQVMSARRELLRLSALAGELLDLSRLDAAVQLRSEPIELGELARAVVAEFGLRARERDVDIEVIPPPAACWGRGDPDAVARVVRILLDNSLRYAPPGEPIQVLAGRSEEGTTIAVTDRGPGIPDEERDRIFERFHRGRAAGSESGFGLGLAIGRELAERMGGRLTLADPPGGLGARFVLTLPAAASAGDGAVPRAARDQGRVLT
jgi:signal transduction histidine kinase